MAQMNNNSTAQPEFQQKAPPKIVSLSTLKPGTDGYHLIVKVMEVIPVVDKIRRDGTRVRVALIVIADAEASVVFVARGDQIDIMTVGSTVQILNAKVEMFNLYDRENESKSRNGFMRLEVEKWGKVIPHAPLQGPVSSKSMSTVEYELVEKTQNDQD